MEEEVTQNAFITVGSALLHGDDFRHGLRIREDGTGTRNIAAD